MGKLLEIHRKKLADKKLAKMRHVLTEFKDLKRLVEITGKRRSTSIIEVCDKNGNLQHDKSDIAEVFACFYEELYASRRADRRAESYAATGEGKIPAFTIDELRIAIKQMRLGRARDMSGIIAEMIKIDCFLLHEMILDLFNDVLMPGAQPPTEWRKSRLVVIFKKGDPKLPANYRPIAILPI